MVDRVTTARAAELATLVSSGAADGPELVEACEALRSLAAERDVLRRLDSEAATHVESVIAMRTGFTGERPYVGWRGVGLALSEALDERDVLRVEAGVDLASGHGLGELDLTFAQRLGMEAIAAARSHAAASGVDPASPVRNAATDREALDTERSALAAAALRDGGTVSSLAAWVGGAVLRHLAGRGFKA